MNPFLHNHQEEEGSLPERLHIRHALSSRKDAVPDVDAEWRRLKERIEARGEGADDDGDAKRGAACRGRGRCAGWIWLTVAAAAVAGIIVSVGLKVRSVMSPHDAGVELYIAEAPAGGHITVSTSGGAKTTLAPMPAKTAPRVVECQAAPDEYVIVETPVGQEIAVVLPDSSTVWLWSDSRLEYPARFSDKERVVTLYGEAYFDVTSSPGCPFIVHTEYFNTRVYGTEFVVRAIGHRDAEVLLVEGSVGVSADGLDEQVRLTAGQEAVLARDGSGAETFEVSEFDPYPLQQWRDGMFFFEDDRLIDILMSIGRWYGISIVSYSDAALDRRIHFVTDRTESPAEVVAALDELLPSIVVEYSDNQISIR